MKSINARLRNRRRESGGKEEGEFLFTEGMVFEGLWYDCNEMETATSMDQCECEEECSDLLKPLAEVHALPSSLHTLHALHMPHIPIQPFSLCPHE